MSVKKMWELFLLDSLALFEKKMCMYLCVRACYGGQMTTPGVAPYPPPCDFCMGYKDLNQGCWA